MFWQQFEKLDLDFFLLLYFPRKLIALFTKEYKGIEWNDVKYGNIGYLE